MANRVTRSERERASFPEHIVVWALFLLTLTGCAGPMGGVASSGGVTTGARPAGLRVIAPPPGKLYVGVFPGNGGAEDAITSATLRQFESATGQHSAWVYFSDEWGNGRSFPLATASWIRAEGRIPYIRLMLRTTNDEYVAEPTFTLERIARGDFDADLAAWGRAAHAFATPLMVEYGTEANGQWFSWNGFWHGKNANGPALFRTAYRHIVQVIRRAGANNITWVFHLNVDDDPQASWNRFENYYPGDDVIDWVGVSVYGSQTPTDPPCDAFRDELDPIYARLTAMTRRPILIAEMGVILNAANCDAPTWITSALHDLLSARWPRIHGVAWWNDWWDNGTTNNPAQITDMRLQDFPQAAAAWRAQVARKSRAIQTS